MLVAHPADLPPGGCYRSPFFRVSFFSASERVCKAFFSVCLFLLLSFMRFGVFLERLGLVLETFGSQKPMNSLGKTMNCTFVAFPPPARKV